MKKSWIDIVVFEIVELFALKDIHVLKNSCSTGSRQSVIVAGAIWGTAISVFVVVISLPVFKSLLADHDEGLSLGSEFGWNLDGEPVAGGNLVVREPQILHLRVIGMEVEVHASLPEVHGVHDHGQLVQRQSAVGMSDPAPKCDPQWPRDKLSWIRSALAFVN